MTPSEARARWDAGLPLTVLPPSHPWRRWLRRGGRDAHVEVYNLDLARVATPRATTLEVPLYNMRGELAGVRSARVMDNVPPEVPVHDTGLVMASPMGLALLRGEIVEQQQDHLGQTWNGSVQIVMGARIMLANGLAYGRRSVAAVLGVTHPDLWTTDLQQRLPRGAYYWFLGMGRSDSGEVEFGAWDDAA